MEKDSEHRYLFLSFGLEHKRYVGDEPASRDHGAMSMGPEVTF